MVLTRGRRLYAFSKTALLATQRHSEPHSNATMLRRAETHRATQYRSVADRSAKDVERAEITALLRELVEAGKGRQAGKLRSYLTQHLTDRTTVPAPSSVKAPDELLQDVGHSTGIATFLRSGP